MWTVGSFDTGFEGPATYGVTPPGAKVYQEKKPLVKGRDYVFTVTLKSGKVATLKFQP